MTGYAGSRDYVREPVVSVKNSTLNTRTELTTRVSESATTGSGSSFSVGCWEQCGVLQGDYRLPT